jgi:hypothetical protein
MLIHCEGSCEYTEKAVADSRQGVILLLGIGQGVNNSSRKNGYMCLGLGLICGAT